MGGVVHPFFQRSLYISIKTDKNGINNLFPLLKLNIKKRPPFHNPSYAPVAVEAKSTANSTADHVKTSLWVQAFKVTQEACGKILSEKIGCKSVKTALFLSNVIDADHKNSFLFTNKCDFSSLLWVLIGVLYNFLSNTLSIVLTYLLDYISTINSV